MSSLQELAQQGMQAIEEKRFTDAIEALTAARELDPSRPDMNSMLGMAYVYRGDAGNGIPFLEKAVELAEPFDQPEVQGMKRDFHLQLVTAYQIMDRIDEAVRALNGVIRRWPSEPAPYLRLGTILFATGDLDEGVSAYEGALPLLEDEDKKAGEVLLAALAAFRESEESAKVFLEAHAGSYKEYFDQVATAQAEHGWYAEAARMARGPDGEPVPIVADGARPYALTRVDLVNPVDGTVSGVYSEQEPMIVAVPGVEPLAEFAITLPWNEWAFDVGVCTRCPWHWLTITIVFDDRGDEDALIDRVDELVGGWYLSGYNGDFGDKDSGRFHYVTDPEVLGDRAVSYTVDLGRARFEAVLTLLNRLTVLHDTHRIDKVLFGDAKLR